jgi:HEPN domain-containing protein
MQEEAKRWLAYSEENFEAAKILLQSNLYNPCLHNVQQSIEKALKSVLIEKIISSKKTHNILELKTFLGNIDVAVDLTEDECDFLDSIYLPTKYPLGSALPSFYPDKTICDNSISIAERVLNNVKRLLE